MSPSVHHCKNCTDSCAIGTGEHGVGIGKKGFLYEELGEGTLELMRTIKKAIDPLNLFNPGKVRLLSTLYRLLLMFWISCIPTSRQREWPELATPTVDYS